MEKRAFSHENNARLFRGIALLLHGGISLADSMFLLAQDAQAPVKPVLTALGHSLDNGNSLHESMVASRHFAPFVTGMIRIGEETGHLENVLEALANLYDNKVRTRQQVQQAVTYPGIILILLLMVVWVLLTKVLPVFDHVYRSLGAPMAGLAHWLLRLGQGLSHAMPLLWIIPACLVGFFLAALYISPVSAWLRSRFGDRGVAARFNNARFARGLAMGLSSALPVEEAIDLAASALDAPGALARVQVCKENLRRGAALSDALAEGKLLSRADCRLLTAAVQSGAADRMMDTIARQMEEDAALALDHAIGLIEPSMVVVSSGLVGAVLLAVMLPLMNILATLG